MRNWPTSPGPRWIGTLSAAVGVLLLASTAVFAQRGFVAGQVLDARSLQPISGAQIVVEGTTTGGLSDSQGQFRIPGLSGPEVILRVQMLGYQTVTETARVGDTEIRVLMRESAVELDEIVVTGTAGGMQKRAVGNAVATVAAADVQELVPVTEVSRLINGRAPGVQIAPGTGMVGAGPRIRIRGTATLSLSDQPLIYVDGVRVNNAVAAGPTNQGYGSGSISRLGDFNPEDIASIEVIKGPAAATLYGTEASNGVIQIITKRGEADTPAQWNLYARQGANWFHDPEERVPTNWGLNEAGELVEVNLIELEEERGTPVFRTGHHQEYGLSVRGGGSSIRYYLSGEFQDSEGIDINNNVWRYSARSNVGFTPSEQWDVSANLGYVKASIGLANDIGSGTLFNGMFSTNVDVEGPRRGWRSAPPEVFRQRSIANQALDRFTGSIEIQNTPTTWLTQRLSLGLDDSQETNTTFSPYLDPYAAQFFSPTVARGGRVAEDVATSYNTVDYGATVTLDVSPSLVSSTSVGAQYYRKVTERLEAEGSEFTGPGLSTVTGTARTTAEEDLIENVTAGTFVQQQLAWQQRAFLTAAVRVDNNSAFGSDFDFVTYPKVSASWVVSEEPFWDVPAVSTLRLRGAYGMSGQQPDAFAALRSFKPVTVSDGQGGVTPEFVGNPELSPERGRELELGFEAGLLDERVGVNFTYYAQNTKDAILLRALAPSGGFPGSQFINIGELQNRGFELQLNAAVVQRDAVTWDVGFNISRNDNKVLDVGDAASGTTLTGADYIRMGSNLDTPGVHLRHQEGSPAGSYFGKKVVSAELDDDGNAVNVLCAGGDVSPTPLPCDDAPEIYLGRSDPNIEGAFTTTLALRPGLTLSGLVDFKLGVYHGENDTLVRCALFRTCEVNFRPQEFDPVFVAQVQSSSLHDFAVADASFVKIRDVSLSYALPQSLAATIGATGARITITGRNLHTWTDWPSLDPETYFLSHQFDKWSQTFTPHPMSFVVSANLRY